MSQGFFVTGTDTGVGKTLASAALLRALSRRGFRTLGMKPIASGCERRGDSWHCEDTALLMGAANISVPFAEATPYAFEAAIAPHVAAARAGINLEISRVIAAFERLSKRGDYVVVEGVGGFLVPLGPSSTLADLAVALNLPVILVVGIRLGCLNHALLTVAAIAARGLPIAGWVANQIDPGMACRDANIAALQERIEAPLLGVIPSMAPPSVESAAANLDMDKLSLNKHSTKF